MLEYQKSRVIIGVLPFVVLAAAAVLPAISQTQNVEDVSCSESYQIDQSHYVFCEDISTESVDKVVSLGNLKTLTMTSRGGTSIEAIRLANYLNQNNIKLILEEYCLSACAQFLMLG